MIRFLSLILICSYAIGADLPQDAQSLVNAEGLKETATKAKFDAEIATLRKELLPKLQKAQEAATKKGDLDGAMAIKAKLAELDVGEAAAPKRVFMGDLPLTKQEAYHFFIAKDEKSSSKSVIVDGKPCYTYIYAVAPSVTEVRVPTGAARFTATGMSLGSKSITFIVQVDGKELAKGDGKLDVAVDLPTGAQKLSLICDPQGDNTADHSVWANPYFEGK